jgi:hypothetical protein
MPHVARRCLSATALYFDVAFLRIGAPIHLLRRGHGHRPAVIPVGLRAKKLRCTIYNAVDTIGIDRVR